MSEFRKVPQYEPAGFWVRFVAFLIDASIVGIISFPVKVPFLIVLIFLSKGAAVHFISALLIGVTHFLNILVTGTITVFYCGYFYKTKGATPGKLLLNLRVMKDPEGTNAGYREAFLRDVLGKTISIIPLFAGYWMVALRKDKRALHDFIGGTIVLKRVD